MKITDSNYVLPKIIATQVIGTAKGGANRPLFIRGIDVQTGNENDFVLKYRGAERMDERTSGRELIASFLAKHLNLTTPEPVTILVTDNFLRHIKQHSDFNNIQKSEGLNFGTVKIEPNNTVVFNQLLTFAQQQQALDIFIFDLWTQNADRRFEKANMFFSNEHLHVIDHELAFGFLDTLTFLRSPQPYILNDTDINAAKNHFFYATLHQNKHINIDLAFQSYKHLTPDFWHRLRQLIPAEWQASGEINQIETHFNQILSHIDTFKQEIWTKILA
jgi:hypothetical protein